MRTGSIVDLNRLFDHVFHPISVWDWNIPESSKTTMGYNAGVSEISGVDVTETETALTLSFYVPGVDKENIKATLKGSVLIVTAEQDKRKYAYQYSVRGVDLNSPTHEHKNGILSVTFTKSAEQTERNILTT